MGIDATATRHSVPDWLNIPIYATANAGNRVEALMRVQTVLNKAKMWLHAEIERVASLDGLEKQDAIRALFTQAIDLDAMESSEFRSALAKQGVKGPRIQ